MARTLDAILAELDAGYTPQRQAIQQRLDALPGQAEAEIQGLQGQQKQAFEDILAGARDRGLGFSGIPVGEQAKYTATQFLPAVARVRQSQNDVRGSLFDALNNIGLDQRKTAMSVYQQELDRDEQARQFNAAQEAQRRAAAQQSSIYNGLFGGGQDNTNQRPQIDPDTQRAYNAVQSLLGTNNGSLIQKTYAAIKDAAGRGNAYDKIKLQLIEQLYPAARNFGRNAVPLGTSRPTTVSLAPRPYTGLSVGVANPSMRLR